MAFEPKQWTQGTQQAVAAAVEAARGGNNPEVTPDHLLGRVNSTYRLVAWGTRPIGAALGGALGQWLGIRSVFAIMGVLTAAVLIPNRRITEQALTAAER